MNVIVLGRFFISNVKAFFFSFVFIACTAQCLDLNNQSTRSRFTKYVKTTPPPRVTIEPSLTEKTLSVEVYKVMSANDVPCILMKVDALVSIYYTNKLNERDEASFFVHHSPKVEGSCKNEDYERMNILSTKGVNLEWSFAKTPGGERWYVDTIKMTYNSSIALLKHPAVRSQLVTLEATESLLFPTPVGKSYVCNRETVLQFNNVDPSSIVDHTAKLYLRELQLQAFMYKKNELFGQTYLCPDPNQVRSEAAPVAVGAALALSTAGILIGYAAWRYMKVKKVQYDTMA